MNQIYLSSLTKEGVKIEKHEEKIIIEIEDSIVKENILLLHNTNNNTKYKYEIKIPSLNKRTQNWIILNFVFFIKEEGDIKVDVKINASEEGYEREVHIRKVIFTLKENKEVPLNILYNKKAKINILEEEVKVNLKGNKKTFEELLKDYEKYIKETI